MSGENVGEAAKTRLKEAGKQAASETLDRIKTKIQGGSGIRKRKRKSRTRFLKFSKFNILRGGKKRKGRKRKNIKSL